MDRENNDRGMIDRTVGEKKEFSFPAMHLPVMAWASLVCFACFALYRSCPPSAGRDAPAQCLVHDCTVAKTGCLRRLDP